MEIIARIDDKPVLNALNRLARKGADLAPALKAVGEELVQSTWDRFNAGGPAPDGTAWAPPRTPNPKRRGTLRVSDQLRDSIRYQTRGRSAVAIGTNKVYGAIHQFGGKTGAHTIRPVRKKALSWPGASHPVKSVRHPGSKIPARPYLGISRTDSDRIVEIVGRFLEMK